MTEDTRPFRCWCAKYQWPKKEPFIFGTVMVRADGPDHEAEQALERAFLEKWGRILPDYVERPRLLALLPGAIFFVKEEEL